MSQPGWLQPQTRVLGEIHSQTAGPTLICVGSLHGNEPAGVVALYRVFDRLRTQSTAVKSGSLVGLVGNLAGLSTNRRFLDRDLNRNWDVTGDRPFDPNGRPLSIEDKEQHELRDAINNIVDTAVGDVFILDLHTTSGDSQPFTVFADTLKSRRFARRLPNPIILGLEEHLEGTMVDYFASRGHAAVAVEGGQHEDPRSVDRLEAIVWIALDLIGIARDEQMLRHGHDLQEKLNASLPHAFEITARHTLSPDDRFRMHPGFRGFDRVKRGQILAADRTGEIQAPSDGFLLMPLYQALGEEGFFITKPVPGYWLTISRVLRTLRTDRIVHWLPGVSRCESRPGVYRVNQKIARFFAIEILHLLGFKRVRDEAELLVTRRRSDQA